MLTRPDHWNLIISLHLSDEKFLNRLIGHLTTLYSIQWVTEVEAELFRQLNSYSDNDKEILIKQINTFYPPKKEKTSSVDSITELLAKLESQYAKL